MKHELKDKVVIATGQSLGIDDAIAKAFSQAGAKVVIASPEVAKGEQAAHEICTSGGEAIFVPTDVSKASDVEALVDRTIAVYGRLDCAVNNAGVGRTSSLVDGSEDDWNYMIDTNLKGMWLCLKYEISQMLKNGSGAIVNVASICGIAGMSGFSIYSASKGGAIALTKAAAIEYAGVGIRINVISPGAVQAALSEEAPPDVAERLKAGHPIGRIGKPEEIASAALWLCSDTASFVTGHNLIIDGGYTAQ